MLKAITEQRSWEHSKHRHLSSSPPADSGPKRATETFAAFSTVANDLARRTSTKTTMSAEDIAESLDDVQALLDRLETLLKQV